VFEISATSGTSIAAGVLFVLQVVVSFLYIRKRREYKMTSSSRLLKYTASGGTPRTNWSSDMESGSIHDLQTHQFTYEELEDATDGFSDEREIGEGGFGTVYKGLLRDGRAVAVKRLYSNSCRRVEQFVNEAAILSRLRHPNLVTLYGCTSSRSRALLLVYEFVANGTCTGTARWRGRSGSASPSRRPRRWRTSTPWSRRWCTATSRPAT
jgi:hypothetical protein